jgi:hypothetical protein
MRTRTRNEKSDTEESKEELLRIVREEGDEIERR